MRRCIPRLVPLVAALLIATGCGSSDSTTTTTPAAAVPQTDTFSETLTANGAFTHPFVVLAAGAITASLATLSPDSARPIGMALGTWNGSSCQIVLANDTSIQGSTVPGSATTSGNFCVRVYDAAGTVVSPQTYVVSVTHP